MSDDITYCGYSCPHVECERHSSHSKYTYDSFAYFHDCDKYPPMEFSQEDVQKLKEKINENRI